MKLLCHDGDLLFHHRIAIDPIRLREEIAVMQIRNRKRYVKQILSRSGKNHFHPISLNPLYPPIENQVSTWVSPILWV